MIKQILFSSLLLSTALNVAISAPANDDFQDAFLVRGISGAIDGSNIGATVESGEPIHAKNDGGASIWYYWNAPRRGLFRFDTFGSDFDTLLSVYRGSSVNNLSLVAGNDQAGSLSTSSTVFFASKGSEYEIAVDGYNDGSFIDTGSLELNWEQINPPSADFNGDDRNDFLFFSPINGAIRYGFLDDRIYLGSVGGPTVPGAFEVADTGDFNLDGDPDIVLRNVNTNRTALWLLDLGRFSASYNGPTLPAGFYLAAVDDFNEDGRDDYLIASSNTGRTVVWTLSGGRYLNSYNGPTLPVGWEISGAADINTDGNPDFVIYQSSTGKTAFWIWNGRRVTKTLSGPTLPAGYDLTGVGDFNRDGLADLIIFLPRANQTVFWTMNRNTFASSRYGPKAPFGFQVSAPR